MVLTSPQNRRRGRSLTKQFQSIDANAAVDTGEADDNNYNDNDEDSSVEPLDEDEQKALVESLHAEAAAQSRFFQQLFGYGIGGFAMIFSLCFPLLCPDECRQEQLCWVHAVYASLVHAWTVHPFILPSSKMQLWKAMVSLMAQAMPWIIWIFGTAFSHDDDHFHLGLMIGNLVTYLGAFVIHWDMKSTNKALKELDDAQYKHKEL
jgi:hypothetical protein